MAGSEPAQKVSPDKDREAEERRLVEAAQSDPARFAGVYEEYFEVVYVYVMRRVRSREEAEDLTSEVFRKALASLPRFKWRGAPFAAWLFRIASNLIADRAKRVAKEGSVSLDSDAEPGSSPPVSKGVNTPSLTVGLLPRSGSSAAQAQQAELEESERRASLFKLVDELPGDQRRVVMMRFAEEKSVHEIAEALGRSEGAVKQLQFRALENLRKRFHHKGHGEDQSEL